MTNNEAAMVRAALPVGIAVAVGATVVAGLLRGLPAAMTALGAVTVVTGMFGVTGRSLGWAAERGPIAVQAVALGGFLLRLVAYVALLVALRGIDAVDGPVLAISGGVAMLAILAREAQLLLTHPEFWFVDADATVAFPRSHHRSTPRSLLRSTPRSLHRSTPRSLHRSTPRSLHRSTTDPGAGRKDCA